MKERFIGKNIMRGIATLEVLIAFAIITLGIGASILLIFGNQTSSASNQTSIEAVSLSQKILEEARAQARFDFQSVVPNLHTTIALGSTLYTKSLEVSQTDFFTKEVSSVVSWEESGKSLFVRLSTLLSNPEGVSTSETCSSVLLGNWKSPLIKSWEFGKDIVNDGVNIFPIADIDMYQDTLYVVLSSSSSNNSPTFFTLHIDRSNPTAKPLLQASIDNDTGVKTGLHGVTATNRYAFLANGLGPTKGQLQIVDLSQNPPTLIKAYKIPGVSGSSSQAVGQTIAHKDGYVYIGLTKTSSGPEFNIVDVGGGTGSPTNPIWVGGYSVGNGINAILIKDSFAYIATPNNEELTVLDISNKANPFRVSGFNAPDNQGNGKSLSIQGNRLYLGRTVTSANPEFYILERSNPPSIPPSPLASKEISSSINGIISRDYLTLLLTNSQFQIWNTANPSEILPWSASLPLPGGTGTALECEGNTIFLSSLPANNKGFISVVTPEN